MYLAAEGAAKDAIAYQIQSLQWTILAMQLGRQRSWWDYTLSSSTAMESVSTNVEYECDAKLGSPDVIACERAAFELHGDKQIVLDPTAPLFIKLAGMLRIPKGTLCSNRKEFIRP